MDYLYAEDPLPTDLHYPLKRSMLDSCLTAAGIDNVHRIFFTRQRRQDRLLQADFWAEGSTTTDDAFFTPGKASVSVFAVPELEEMRAAGAIIEEALPKLCAWLRKARDEASQWRSQSHFIAFRLADSGLEIIEH